MEDLLIKIGYIAGGFVLAIAAFIYSQVQKKRAENAAKTAKEAEQTADTASEKADAAEAKIDAVIAAADAEVTKAKQQTEAAIEEATEQGNRADELQDKLTLKEALQGFIENAENIYETVNEIKKAQDGSGAGEQKKESVLAKLYNFAKEKGLNLGLTDWSAEIDALINFTKKVN